MKSIFTISAEELNSEKWDKARAMCARYGYDIHEIASGLARFRMIRAEFRAKALAEQAAKQPQPLPPAPATLVHFNTVRAFWDFKTRTWTKPGIVYIGRAWLNQGLPASPFGNPFRIEKDADELRENAIELYADWLMQPAQAHLLRQLDSLRGQTLVCWCKSAGPGKASRACHGDVLLQLMQDKPSYADVPVMEKVRTDEAAPDYQPARKFEAF